MAIVRTETFDVLSAMGLPMRGFAQDGRRVVVTHHLKGDAMRLRRVWMVGLLALTQLVVAQVAPAAQREIDEILDGLLQSGCEFNRNGIWHTGAEAKKHLLQKLDYIRMRTRVQTAEEFIRLAASNSSTSGKPYLVRCQGKTPVESQEWLLSKLKSLRDTRPPSQN